MDDAEFQRYLNAPSPLIIKFGFWQKTLILDKDGFKVKGCFPFIDLRSITIRRPWKMRSYQWRNVSEFYRAVRTYHGWSYGQDNRISFDIIPSDNMPFLSRLFFVSSDGLPANYGFTVDQLAQLMNHWRERSNSGNGLPKDHGTRKKITIKIPVFSIGVSKSPTALNHWRERMLQ